MRADRQHQKRHRQRDDASDGDLQHTIDRGFDGTNVDEPRNQEHQHPREGCNAEAGINPSQKGQRRHREREDACERDII
jgi:hypothetical protein